MIETVFSEINRIFQQIWLWMQMVNNKIPFLTIALGLFLVSTIMRFIIYPMLKPDLRAGSDSVKPKKNKSPKIKSAKVHKK